jgi:alkylation response protein AidB-like acyl-CoA dehydrogenase
VTARAELHFDAWHDPAGDPLVEERVSSLVSALAPGVVERDRKGSSPVEEAAALRASGLLALTIDDTSPVYAGAASHHDGIVRRWRAALRAVRRVARTDVSAAALLGYTYMHLLRVEIGGDRDVFLMAVRDSLAAPLLWGGANNPRGQRATLTRVEGGYRLNGRKNFATGSQVADRLVIAEAWPEENNPDGRLTFVLDAGDPCIEHPDDWRGFGVTRSASGSVVFRDVFVPDEAVFSRAEADPAKRSVVESLGSLAFQILFVNLLTGAAQGAIETAAVHLQRTTAGSGITDDADTLAVLGLAASTVSAAAALGDLANDVFAVSVAEADSGRLTPERRGRAGDIISRAKVVADRASLEVATQVVEAAGARGATVDLGLDRFWRDIRTYTLHDSVAVKKREVGAYVLNGRLAVPSNNS